MGLDSACTLSGNEPLRANGFTRKASGLNCTWSIVALTIGRDNSSILPEAVARLAARVTLHCSSRGSLYSSTTGFGRANSRQRDVAEAFFALEETWNNKLVNAVNDYTKFRTQNGWQEC